MRSQDVIILMTCLLLICEPVFSASLYGSKMTRQQIQDSDKDGVINMRDRCQNTPLNAEVDNYGCHKSVPHLLYVKLEVLFHNDSDQVRPIYYKEIKKLANFMQDNPSAKVIIEGHTDSVGRQAYNQILSLNRARAIVDILIHSFKISKWRVKAKGYGENKPTANNNTLIGKSQNRRVIAEISIQTKIDISRWNIYSVDSNK